MLSAEFHPFPHQKPLGAAYLPPDSLASRRAGHMAEGRDASAAGKGGSQAMDAPRRTPAPLRFVP